jgi:hypothetical protein
MAWNGRGEEEGPLRGPSLESRLAAQASVRRTRLSARLRLSRVLVCAVLFAGISATCGPSGAEIEEVIARAKPLIVAIKAYDAGQGHPPTTLQDLIPKYIEAIPSTGLAETPAYSYSVGSKGPRSWWLSVRVGGGGFFRQMRYDPQRQFEVAVSDLTGGWVMIDP